MTIVCTVHPYPGTARKTWPNSIGTPELSLSYRPRPPWCETSRSGAIWITLLLHCPSANNSVFFKSFKLKRTKLSEAWDWHAGDTMRTQHLWGTVLYFSIQCRSRFIANFAINHQNSTLNQTSVSGIVSVALKTAILFFFFYYWMQITYIVF